MAKWSVIEVAIIAGLTLASMAISIFAIATRYFAPEYSLDWADEMVVYLITWAIWLAGARAILTSGHVQSDFIVEKLSPSWRLRLALLQDLGAALFCFTVMIGGIQVVRLALYFGERSESSLAMPLWIYYLCLPVGLASITIRYLEKLLGGGDST